MGEVANKAVASKAVASKAVASKAVAREAVTSEAVALGEAVALDIVLGGPMLINTF